MKPIPALAITLAGTFAHATLAHAPTPTPASLARPFHLSLDLADPVPAANAGSPDLQIPALPVITRLLEPAPARRHAANPSSMFLDPGQLQQLTELDARTSLVGDSAGYANTLGFNTTATPSVTAYVSQSAENLKVAYASTDNPAVRRLIADVLELKSAGATADVIVSRLADRRGFSTDPDQSGASGLAPRLLFQGTSGPVAGALPAPEPAAQGIELEPLSAGAHLDFFLIANAARTGQTPLPTQASSTPDGISHMVSFAYALGDSPYLILGFEHLYGSDDREADDRLFAIHLGASHVAALTATPEPATWLTLGGCTALGMWWRRKSTVTTPSPRAAVSS